MFPAPRSRALVNPKAYAVGQHLDDHHSLVNNLSLDDARALHAAGRQRETAVIFRDVFQPRSTSAPSAAPRRLELR